MILPVSGGTIQAQTGIAMSPLQEFGFFTQGEVAEVQVGEDLTLKLLKNNL